LMASAEACGVAVQSILTVGGVGGLSNVLHFILVVLLSL